MPLLQPTTAVLALALLLAGPAAAESCPPGTSCATPSEDTPPADDAPPAPGCWSSGPLEV